ncbi:hypothetical protein KCV07_g483, partial [Aureobasidium melanogenum]
MLWLVHPLVEGRLHLVRRGRLEQLDVGELEYDERSSRSNHLETQIQLCTGHSVQFYRATLAPSFSNVGDDTRPLGAPFLRQTFWVARPGDHLALAAD